MLTLILLLLILAGFTAMTCWKVPQEVALSLVALGALALAGAPDNEVALHDGFKELSRVALLFTAVAVPAHLLMRANALRWLGMLIGEAIGGLIGEIRAPSFIVVPSITMVMIWATAALAHNTTSILTMAPVAIVICESYKLPLRPTLAGALIASNLGGFSTRWGDTPNITEAAIFNLTHADFFREILPVNLILLALVTAIVIVWTKVELAGRDRLHGLGVALAKEDFRRTRVNMGVDYRLLCIGFVGLMMAVMGPMLFPHHEIAISAGAILVSILLDRAGDRQHALLALGAETYLTFAAIFVLARILTGSHIGVGARLQGFLASSGSQVWRVAAVSYIGTLLTEAASWASAASRIVFSAAPSHGAAWALGGGICAGSSSLTTAASAGILLVRETKYLPPEDRITFGTYLWFGLAASLVMLAYYIVVLTIWKF
jgi:Na+/H+ antiporter NhaD/arsenite permease-like protein